jgi:hypothetical protein
MVFSRFCRRLFSSLLKTPGTQKILGRTLDVLSLRGGLNTEVNINGQFGMYLGLQSCVLLGETSAKVPLYNDQVGICSTLQGISKLL